MDTNLVMDLAILIADRLSKTVEWGIADAERRGGTDADR